MKSLPGTVVDSSVWLDVFTEDTTWGDWSTAELIAAAMRGPLILNAVVFAEIAPRFMQIEKLDAALPPTAVLDPIPRSAAFLAGHAHAAYRGAGGARTQVLPDFLIGAHAAVTGRPLLTRDPRRVAAYLPGTRIIAPPG